MRNSSQVSHFTLGAYVNTGPLRWLYFLIIISVYALIVLSNLLLIVVICFSRTLHEPMYIFLCSLFVNELYGSTALLPFLLGQILQDVHTISYSFCFLQIFFIHLYGSVEFLMLAVMSYDRYLAICFPLQYHTRMNSRKVLHLIAFAWLYCILQIVVLVSLNASLQRCDFVIPKVYCDNYTVVKLACSNITVNNIYGILITIFIAFIPAIFILYTYMRILQVCFLGSKQTRQKVFSTCTPHLASVINYCCGSLFEILQSRFEISGLHPVLRIVLSLYWLTCQPLFNPLMYGLKLSKIRAMCKNVLRKAIKI